MRLINLISGTQFIISLSKVISLDLSLDLAHLLTAPAAHQNKSKQLKPAPKKKNNQKQIKMRSSLNLLHKAPTSEVINRKKSISKNFPDQPIDQRRSCFNLQNFKLPFSRDLDFFSFGEERGPSN